MQWSLAGAAAGEAVRAVVLTGAGLRLPDSGRRASLLMAFARVGLGADSGASWTLQRLAGGAQEQSERGGTADHRAATFAFLNREQPVFEGR